MAGVRSLDEGRLAGGCSTKGPGRWPLQGRLRTVAFAPGRADRGGRTTTDPRCAGARARASRGGRSSLRHHRQPAPRSGSHSRAAAGTARSARPTARLRSRRACPPGAGSRDRDRRGCEAPDRRGAPGAPDGAVRLLLGHPRPRTLAGSDRRQPRRRSRALPTARSHRSPRDRARTLRGRDLPRASMALRPGPAVRVAGRRPSPSRGPLRSHDVGPDGEATLLASGRVSFSQGPPPGAPKDPSEGDGRDPRIQPRGGHRSAESGSPGAGKDLPVPSVPSPRKQPRIPARRYGRRFGQDAGAGAATARASSFGSVIGARQEVPTHTRARAASPSGPPGSPEARNGSGGRPRKTQRIGW